MVDRDKLGRFVKGHKPINLRDRTTGRFISSVFKTQDEYHKYKTDKLKAEVEQLYTILMDNQRLVLKRK